MNKVKTKLEQIEDCMFRMHIDVNGREFVFDFKSYSYESALSYTNAINLMLRDNDLTTIVKDILETVKYVIPKKKR